MWRGRCITISVTLPKDNEVKPKEKSFYRAKRHHEVRAMNMNEYKSLFLFGAKKLWFSPIVCLTINKFYPGSYHLHVLFIDFIWILKIFFVNNFRIIFGDMFSTRVVGFHISKLLLYLGLGVISIHALSSREKAN